MPLFWQYDDNSNRIQQNKDNRQQQYHYNANQELIEISSDDQTTHYQYNSYGRLATVIENEQTIASYGYNVFGQRTSKTINDLTTYYHYSEQGLESEYNEQGELMQGYYYSPQNSLGDAPVAIKHNDNGITQTSYYQNDHLNTPQMLTRPNGAVVWQGQYDAFGEVTQTNTQVSNPLRFPGQYQDDETGLHYNWYRYYDNSIGRYVTRDPIGLVGGMNTYAYVGGNPLMYTDPNGLCPCGNPKDVAATAAGYTGSRDWSFYKPKGRFDQDTNKCNLFVEDVLLENGSNVPDMNGRFSFNGATAGQWGDPNVDIPGYPVVTNPKPGDIIAIPFNYSDATGHVGIVTGSDITTSQSSKTDRVESNDWGFRPGQSPVFRRCSCSK